MNGVLDVVLSCEHDEHFRIGRLKAKLPTDRDQTSVFRIEKWQKTNAIIQDMISNVVGCFDFEQSAFKYSSDIFHNNFHIKNICIL